MERIAASLIFSTPTPLSGDPSGQVCCKVVPVLGLSVEDSYRDFIGERIIVPGPVLNETSRKEMQT